MRSLKDNQNLTPVQVDSTFPYGAIIDDTPSTPGTAVVREVYNDPLVNLYKLMDLVGVTTNGQEDSELNGYQLLGALQKLPNVTNDILRQLTLSSTVFTVDMDISRFPNKYVFFAKVVGAYGAGTYTIQGSTASPSYSFTSPTGFNDGAYLLICLDQTGAIAIAITAGATPSSSATFTAADIIGSDPFFALPLSSTTIPAMPKYLTIYVKNGDGDNQNKMIQPVQYVADTKIILGMSSPTDFPSQVITIFWA